MKHIKCLKVSFNIDNIFQGETVTTYIKYGNAGDYSVNISKSGSRKVAGNLTFNTSIKATPAAQGGQAPVKMIIELLKRNASGITFANDNKKYPTSREEFLKQSSEFKKYYAVVEKYFNGAPTYPEFEMLIGNFI